MRCAVVRHLIPGGFPGNRPEGYVALSGTAGKGSQRECWVHGSRARALSSCPLLPPASSQSAGVASLAAHRIHRRERGRTAGPMRRPFDVS